MTRFCGLLFHCWGFACIGTARQWLDRMGRRRRTLMVLPPEFAGHL